MRFLQLPIAIPLLLIALPLSSAPLPAQQSDVAVSPFVTLPPSTGPRPLAGLGLTLAGSPTFGLRGAGRMALKNSYAGPASINKWLPTWGADVDGLFALSGNPFGSVQRSASTFMFIGIGESSRDTADVRLTHANWSYGLGAIAPLGSVVDLFIESRWRVPRLVLPTAHPHPEREKEYWIGMSFHVNRGTNQNGGRRRR
jgi:hypothetical protein